MISGYLCAALLLLLLLKIIARKSGLGKFNQLMRNIHKPVGILLIVLTVLHLLLTIPVWDTRAASIIITGCATALLILLMTVSYLLRRKYATLWLRWHRLGAAGVMMLLIVHISGYFIDFGEYQTKIAQINLAGVNAEQVMDGTYTGSCDAGYINAKVRVTVEDGVIKEVELLEHNNERGDKAEVIPDKIIMEQTTKVDAVSGATNSSKVIIKAVENALLQGVKGAK